MVSKGQQDGIEVAASCTKLSHIIRPISTSAAQDCDPPTRSFNKLCLADVSFCRKQAAATSTASSGFADQPVYWRTAPSAPSP